MATGKKQVQQLARQLYKLSFVDGKLSDTQVQGVLGYLELHPPAQPLSVLRAYRRLIAAEVARGVALVEHAGPVSAATLAALSASFTKHYQRPIHATARPAASLLAGLRVRVGDDVYESSVASQLRALATAV